MKKNVNIVITLILLILSILITGCTYNAGKNEKVGGNSNRPTNKTTDSTNTNENNAPLLDLSSFLGEWDTTKRLVIPRVYSEKELKENDMVGHKVIIKPDFFSDGSSQYEDPYYKVSEITIEEFEGENISSFSDGDLINLNIHKKSNITKLDVFSEKNSEFLIETFYLEDENTLITNSNYIAIFELKRIK